MFQLVKMFGFVLDRPQVRDQLHPQLTRLVTLVLKELDQTKLLFHSHRDKCRTFGRFCPTAAARLTWAQQFRLRAQETLKSYRTVQHL